MFLRFPLTIFHYLNQWWLVYRCIYASLGLNELTQWGLKKCWPCWLIMVLVITVALIIIGSSNGLSPVRCQVITWTNADLSTIGLSWTKFSEIWFIYISIEENEFEDAICKITAILFRSQCVNSLNPEKNFDQIETWFWVCFMPEI